MYTIPPQDRFTEVLWGALVVQMDTGDYVAVRADVSVEPNTGNPVVKAEAWRVNGTDGTELPDCNGQRVHAAFSHTSCPGEIESLGSISEVQKRVIKAVLGEDTSPLWTDPIHSTVLEHASIRPNLEAACHTGPVADLGSLLA